MIFNTVLDALKRFSTHRHDFKYVENPALAGFPSVQVVDDDADGACLSPDEFVKMKCPCGAIKFRKL